MNFWTVIAVTWSFQWRVCVQHEFPVYSVCSDLMWSSVISVVTASGFTLTSSDLVFWNSSPEEPVALEHYYICDNLIKNIDFLLLRLWISGVCLSITLVLLIIWLTEKLTITMARCENCVPLVNVNVLVCLNWCLDGDTCTNILWWNHFYYTLTSLFHPSSPSSPLFPPLTPQAWLVLWLW